MIKNLPAFLSYFSSGASAESRNGKQQNTPLNSLRLIRRIKVFTIFLITLLVIIFIIPVQVKASDINLLQNPWHLAGNNGDAQAYQQIDKNILQGKDRVQVTYDLHGACVLTGDASAIIFDQNGWKYAQLAKYGQNCKDGEQTITIPLSDFKDINTDLPLNANVPISGSLHVRFWYNKNFIIDITNITLFGSGSNSGSVSITPTGSTPNPSLLPVSSSSPSPTQIVVSPTQALSNALTQSWAIQSVDAMKYTKDAVCGQMSDEWIGKWVDKAIEVGANYVAISTPYDNPDCASSVAYTNKWVTIIHAKGIHVWFRQMPLAFEGIYNISKNTSSNFFDLISQYIKTNKDNYQIGDIFTPIPEPQNGGIANITYCPQNICQFASKEEFNKWIRDAMDISRNAFDSIGKKDMKIGYFGFDGFVAWGDHNPDWHGILEDATITQMGNITIDHYPEAIGETMKSGLDQLQAKYPSTPIIIGEWGTITGGNTVQEAQDSMGAANRKNVVGFNYWQFGPGGSGEQLINSDFTNDPQFPVVESFYKHK